MLTMRGLPIFGTDASITPDGRYDVSYWRDPVKGVTLHGAWVFVKAGEIIAYGIPGATLWEKETRNAPSA